MTALATHLAGAGIQLTPLRQEGRELTLGWDPQITGPILGSDVLVALPDMHMSDGGPGDVFVGLHGGADQRLARLLEALVAARVSFPTMSAVQLGDLYDVWRAYPEHRDHPTGNYDKIETAHGEVLGLLLRKLRARVCIGNHDASLGLFPPAWAQTANGVTGRLAYGHLFSGGRVLAFHGHQVDRLEDIMKAQGGTAVVKAMTWIAASISKPLSQIAQDDLDLAAELIDDPEWSFKEMLAKHWPLVDSVQGAVGYSSPCWCLRNGRERMGEIAGALPGAARLQLLIVGHSHCPGISTTSVNGRVIPIVDVGSWVHGKSQLAIAEEGRLTVYTMA